MSRYTTELRYICESLADFPHDSGYDDINAILEKSWDKIFDFDFPLHDPAYKKELCLKILKHYYTQEIGAETYGLWKTYLERTMQEIMPYYSQMYATTLLKYEPLIDTDITTTIKGKGTANSQGHSASENTANTNSTQDSENWNAYSRTPQTSLIGVKEGKYLTDATLNTDQSKGHSDSKSNSSDNFNNISNSTNDSTATTKGKSGGKSYMELLKEYRQTIVNIDMDIIKDLQPLFMALW